MCGGLGVQGLWHEGLCHLGDAECRGHYVQGLQFVEAAIFEACGMWWLRRLGVAAYGGCGV